MSNAIIRGVVNGGTVTLLDKMATLAEGTEVLITPVSDASGSPSSVLAAVENAPRVPAAWVDELEYAIAQGRRQPLRQDPFEDRSTKLGDE